MWKKLYIKSNSCGEYVDCILMIIKTITFKSLISPCVLILCDISSVAIILHGYLYLKRPVSDMGCFCHTALTTQIWVIRYCKHSAEQMCQWARVVMFTLSSCCPVFQISRTLYYRPYLSCGLYIFWLSVLPCSSFQVHFFAIMFGVEYL